MDEAPDVLVALPAPGVVVELPAPGVLVAPDAPAGCCSGAGVVMARVFHDAESVKTRR
ncbi:hypothetical protein GCM10009625_05020 [Brachybacterium fresconis]